jgi:hypothetical protein
LHAGNIQVESGKDRLLDTRKSVVRGWLGLRHALRADGRDGLSREVERCLKGIQQPWTERESIAQGQLQHARMTYARDREPLAR